MDVTQKYVANQEYIPLIQEYLLAGHSTTFTVRGRSMRIFIEGDRDAALLMYVRPEDVQEMDIVLAEVRPKTYVLHRVIRREGDTLTLMGDGNVLGTETCKVQQVIGRAEGFYRGRKRRFISVHSRRFRCYSWCWVRLRPIRRYLLFIWRKTHGWE